MSDCIFCKIANHEIPSKAAYEDDMIYSFYDLEPQAPVHVLIVPRNISVPSTKQRPKTQSFSPICF